MSNEFTKSAASRLLSLALALFLVIGCAKTNTSSSTQESKSNAGESALNTVRIQEQRPGIWNCKFVEEPLTVQAEDAPVGCIVFLSSDSRVVRIDCTKGTIHSASVASFSGQPGDVIRFSPAFAWAAKLGRQGDLTTLDVFSQKDGIVRVSRIFTAGADPQILFRDEAMLVLSGDKASLSEVIDLASLESKKLEFPRVQDMREPQLATIVSTYPALGLSSFVVRTSRETYLQVMAGPTGFRRAVTLPVQPLGASSICFTKDGAWAFGAQRDFDGKGVIFRASVATEAATIVGDRFDEYPRILSCSGKDACLIVTDSGSLLCWKVDEGTITEIGRVAPPWVTTVSLSYEGSVIAYVAKDGSVVVIDAMTVLSK